VEADDSEDNRSRSLDHELECVKGRVRLALGLLYVTARRVCGCLGFGVIEAVSAADIKYDSDRRENRTTTRDSGTL